MLNMCVKTQIDIGYIFRTLYNFSNVQTIKLLYNVPNKLEYITSGQHSKEQLYTLTIENYQRNFTRLIYKRTNGNYPFVYSSIFNSEMVFLDTLQSRRQFMHVLQYYFLLNNKLDNLSILGCIHLYVPNKYLIDTERQRHQLLTSPAT